MKKKKKQKLKRPEFILIKKTIFPYDILFTTANHEKVIKYIEWRKSYTLSEEEKSCLEMTGRGRTVRLRGGQTIIRVKKEQTKLGVDLAIVAHEVAHAVYLIFEKAGISHTNESDEAYAYYQEYVIRQILLKLDK